MKNVFALICTLGLSTVALAADGPALKADHKAEIEKELIGVEHTLNEAFKARDEAGMKSMIGEDFVFVGDDGKTVDRAKFIGEATTHIRVEKYTETELTAHSYGDTGIVTGLFKGTVSADGQTSEFIARFVDTFVRRDKHWWAVAGQMTKAGD